MRVLSHSQNQLIFRQLQNRGKKDDRNRGVKLRLENNNNDNDIKKQDSSCRV